MKKWIKILTLAGLIFGGVILHSSAFANFSQSASNGYFDFQSSGFFRLQWHNGSLTTIFNSATNNGLGFVATSTTDTFTNIYSVTASFKQPNAISDTIYATIRCTDGTGVHTDVSPNVAIPSSATSFSDLTFSFSPLPCDSATMTYLIVYLTPNAGSFQQGLQMQGTDSSLQPNTGLTYYEPSPGDDAFNSAYNLTIAFTTSSSSGSNSISWQSPNFSDGFSSTDFSSWWTCVDISTGSAGSSIGYNVTVHYGTSTSTMTTTDDIASVSGYASLPSLPLSECPLINKTSSSTPGTYYAYATLARHSPFSGDTDIATSSIISFEITPGFTTVTPGTGHYCSTVGVSDPIKKAFGCKMPFVYMYQTLDIFQALAAADNNATFTELSLVFPEIQYMHNATFTIPFFSKTEMLKLLPQTTWDFIKALEGAGVIIAFGFLFFHRVAGFWHPTDNHHDS